MERRGGGRQFDGEEGRGKGRVDGEEGRGKAGLMERRG